MTHPDGPMTGRPPTRAPRGMVTTPHAAASSAGLDVLRVGGSAVDAAIAANATLCVVYPHMAGLGGDGFWLVKQPDGDVRGLNASGPAAADATREYYRERGLDDIPERGPLAALTVPGAVDGWRRAHEEYGRLPWTALFDDAIRHAREGTAVSRSLADWLVEDVPELTAHPSSGDVFLDNGQPRPEGELFAQPALADSLERIAEAGARAFYEGDIAEHIVADIGDRGSPLSTDDFAAFTAEWVEPLSTTYRGYRAYEFPPNTQGLAAIELLNLLDGFDVAAWGDGTADYYHHLAEAVKLAFADRDAWVADPGFVDIPTETLTSAAYADGRRQHIDAGHAQPAADVEPGIDFDGDSRQVDAGGDTVAFSVVDEDGLAVSAIQSIYHDFGSAVVGGDTGILMQNRGASFSLADGHPNRLEPGKRPFHTLIPGLLCEDGEARAVYGTMGGEGQPQTHAALVTRLVDFGYDVQQAIEAPRWLLGRTWGAESHELSLEGRVSDGVVRELRRRGQPATKVEDWSERMGHAQAIWVDGETGWLEGGADPRGDGAALGY